MIARVSWALTLLAALLMAGCGTSGPARPDRFYSLDPVPLIGPDGSTAPAILLVNDLAARGFLGGRQIVYRTREEPLVAQRYDDLLWEEPPTRTVAGLLVNAIRTAEVFRFVVIPADRARSDYILGGSVERFEHRPTDQPPRVLVSYNLTLVRSDDRGSMASRQYSGEEPVDGPTPDDMADAFNRLNARLAAEVVRDLQGLKPHLRGSPNP